jgi:hypothetical protein
MAFPIPTTVLTPSLFSDATYTHISLYGVLWTPQSNSPTSVHPQSSASQSGPCKPPFAAQTRGTAVRPPQPPKRAKACQCQNQPLAAQSGTIRPLSTLPINLVSCRGLSLPSPDTSLYSRHCGRAQEPPACAAPLGSQPYREALTPRPCTECLHASPEPCPA